MTADDFHAKATRLAMLYAKDTLPLLETLCDAKASFDLVWKEAQQTEFLRREGQG